MNCVFVFAPDGKIKACILNAPGTFHDSAIADYGAYEKMEEIYNLYGGKVVVDSAFNLANKNYLVKSSQRDPDDAHGIVLNREATSVRQLSEWGMRMIQGSFPRLKDKSYLMKSSMNGKSFNTLWCCCTTSKLIILASIKY